MIVLWQTFVSIIKSCNYQHLDGSIQNPCIDVQVLSGTKLFRRLVVVGKNSLVVSGTLCQQNKTIDYNTDDYVTRLQT